MTLLLSACAPAALGLDMLASHVGLTNAAGCNAHMTMDPAMCWCAFDTKTVRVCVSEYPESLLATFAGSRALPAPTCREQLPGSSGSALSGAVADIVVPLWPGFRTG